MRRSLRSGMLAGLLVLGLAVPAFANSYTEQTINGVLMNVDTACGTDDEAFVVDLWVDAGYSMGSIEDLGTVMPVRICSLEQTLCRPSTMGGVTSPIDRIMCRLGILDYPGAWSDLTSSLKIRSVPPGCGLRFYRHAGFEGEVLELPGTDRVNDLATVDFADRITSLKRYCS